jgi:hypothetical protein
VGEPGAGAEGTGGVTWAEVARRLKSEGVTISRATVRKYQERGLIPSPRPVGRVGRGRGVDWVWPEEQAEMVIARIRSLRLESGAGRRLRRITKREAHRQMYWLFDQSLKLSPPGTVAYLVPVRPDPDAPHSASLGANLIECGLAHLDMPMERAGQLLILFAPDPEPADEDTDG